MGKNLALRDDIVDSLERIDLNNVQAKLSAKAKPSLIGRGCEEGCWHKYSADADLENSC